jgi:hypothetical protein
MNSEPVRKRLSFSVHRIIERSGRAKPLLNLPAQINFKFSREILDILGSSKNCLACHLNNGPKIEEDKTIIDILDKVTGQSVKQRARGIKEEQYIEGSKLEI